MSDIECPYCGADNEINHDDGYGNDESETYNQECRECEKVFTFTTSIMFLYSAEKAPCLNGGEHKWSATVTAPKWHTKIRCEHCDETRAPTESEKSDNGIPEMPDCYRGTAK